MCTQRLEELGLDELCDGDAACLVGTEVFARELRRLDLSRDQSRSLHARLQTLAQHGLDECVKLKSFSRLKKAGHGLFEVRKEGVRFYGGRLPGGDKEHLVLLGAENKSGNVAADADLLARCKQELATLSNALTAEEPGNKAEPKRGRAHHV